MLYRIKIKGVEGSGLLQNCGFRAFDDGYVHKEEKASLTKKRSKLTEVEVARLREIECHQRFWLSGIFHGEVTIPDRVLKRNLDAGARNFKDGPKVREGVFIAQKDIRFEYDRSLGETPEELAKNPKVKFQVPVKIGQSKVVSCRPLFEEWACEFVCDVDDDRVDKEDLVRWLNAGARKGIGDWRPEKGGGFGRYELVSVEEVDG